MSPQGGLSQPRPTLVGLLALESELPGPLDLSPLEEARWKLLKPLRARQYRAGRWLLRRLCAQVAQVDPGSLSLNAEGAPVAVGPAGRELPRLSLTHSGAWLAATACFGPAGVDLEVRGARRDWQGLALRAGLPADAGEEAVLRAWTLREARFKAGGEAGSDSAVWRFETPAYLGCLVAPSGSAPDLHCFGGVSAVKIVKASTNPLEPPCP